MSDQATDVALVLVDLVGDHRAFPDDAARDLHRLLGHRLASPPTGVLRYDRLQLLLRMLLDAAVVPTFDEYEACRQADTSDAPAASTLVNAYGHWLSACDASARFLGTPVRKSRTPTATPAPTCPTSHERSSTRSPASTTASAHGQRSGSTTNGAALNAKRPGTPAPPTHASRRWDRSPRRTGPTTVLCSSLTTPQRLRPQPRRLEWSSLRVPRDAARTGRRRSGSSPSVRDARRRPGVAHTVLPS